MKKVIIVLAIVLIIGVVAYIASSSTPNFKASKQKVLDSEAISVFSYNPNAPHSPAAFSTINSQSLTPNQQKGQQIYAKWCLPCHGVDMPGTNALQALYKGDIPALLEDRDDFNPEIIAMWVRTGKHSMPFFRKSEINDEELRFLGEYLSRNARQ